MPNDQIPESLQAEFKKYPFLKSEYEAGQAAGKSKAEFEIAKDVGEKGAKAEAAEERAVRDRADYDKYREMFKPIPVFKPTQESALDLGAIFSMIGTMGVALGGSGKLSGMNAMNAMSGMLEGYKKGRKDLFDKEQDTFEKELQSIKAQNDQLLKDLQELQKLSATDYEAASAKKAEIAAKNGDFVKKYLENEQTQNLYELTKGISKLHTQILEKSLKTGVVGGKIDPFVRNEIQKHYPDYDASKLIGLNKAGADRINESLQTVKEAEHIAGYIKQHPESIGGIAKLRNIVNLDAIKSITGDTPADAQKKAEILDSQIDNAVTKNKITYDEAKSAKVLNKMLFSLALSDVRSSGQRGSIYLDKKFQEIYDQASRIDTFANILYERSKAADNLLEQVDMDISKRNDISNFELITKTGENWANEYFPMLTPKQIGEGIKNGTIKNGQWFRGTDGRVRQINVGSGAQ